MQNESHRKPVNPAPRPSGPSLKYVFAFGVALVLSYGLFRLIIEIKEVFLLTFFSTLLAVPMNSLITLLSRWIPRAISVMITLLLLGGLIGGIGAVSVPIVAEQGRDLIQKLPEASRKLENWYLHAQHVESTTNTKKRQQVVGNIQEQASKAVGPILQKAVPVVTGSVSGVLMTFYVLVLAAFLAANPQGYHQGIQSLLPKKHWGEFDLLWNRLDSDLVRWLKGILVSMSIMGVLTAIGLRIIGHEQWLLLGILTFVGTFVPYLGAFISSVPGLVLGLAESDTKLLYTLLVYVGIHLTEGHLVQPLVMKRAVEIRPGVLLFWQFAIGTLLGISGIIVATPLLVCLKTLLDFFYTERYVDQKA